MEILSIATQKGINVYAVKGSWQLDHSIQSKIVAMAFSMASEIERDLISKRTKEALMAKKAWIKESKSINYLSQFDFRGFSVERLNLYHVFLCEWSCDTLYNHKS